MVKKRLKSNRHKKLKAVDPFYTGERKLLIDKGLINANQSPKLNEDENKLPMKIKEYLELNEKIKESRKNLFKSNSKVNRKLKKQEMNRLMTRKPDDKGAEVAERPVKKFQKSKQESELQFLTRIDKHTENVINRSKYETQYEVKLETNEDKVIVKKEKKMSDKKRLRLNKLRDKLKNKKLEKKNSESNDKFKDKVKFGEVVDQPPTLTSFPRLPKNGITKPNKLMLTIPLNKPGKNGITESDRNTVIQRYRMMKNQGKFNV